MARTLLSVNADAKTSKGAKRGFLTGVQYLAPANGSGWEVCIYRTAGCTDGCLFTAGRASFNPKIPVARLARTRFFFEDRSAYWQQLIREIRALIRKAEREDLTPVVRLNGTSDLPWERISVVIDGEFVAPNIMAVFPGITFYDYTKWPLSRRVNLPGNYDLTFSYAETAANREHARQALESGGRVAVVFSTKRGAPLPAMFEGFEVVDGDASDLRFLDPAGVVVGLRAKGKARKDESGFVVNAELLEVPVC